MVRACLADWATTPRLSLPAPVLSTAYSGIWLRVLFFNLVIIINKSALGGSQA